MLIDGQKDPIPLETVSAGVLTCLEAVNSIDRVYTPYFDCIGTPAGASVDAAAAQAAHDVLVGRFPSDVPGKLRVPFGRRDANLREVLRAR